MGFVLEKASRLDERENTVLASAKMSQEAFDKDSSLMNKAVSFVEKHPLVTSLGLVALAGATYAVVRGRFSTGLNLVDSSAARACGSNLADIDSGEALGKLTAATWDKSKLAQVELNEIDGVGLRSSAL